MVITPDERTDRSEFGGDGDEESAASNGDAEAAAADFPNAAKEEADEATSRSERRWIRDEGGGGEVGVLGDDEDEDEDEVLDRRRAFIAAALSRLPPPPPTDCNYRDQAHTDCSRVRAAILSIDAAGQRRGPRRRRGGTQWRMRITVRSIGDSVLSLRRETRGVKKRWVRWVLVLNSRVLRLTYEVVGFSGPPSQCDRSSIFLYGAVFVLW